MFNPEEIENDCDMITLEDMKMSYPTLSIFNVEYYYENIRGYYTVVCDINTQWGNRKIKLPYPSTELDYSDFSWWIKK